MSNLISRRESLRILAAGGLITILPPATKAASEDNSLPWRNTNDRVWLGGEFWANPMEDWRIENGWAQCITDSTNRSIHHLTHQITNPRKGFAMAVRLHAGEGKDAGGGFRVGVRSELNEYRSNCFAKRGIDAGIQANQTQLFIGTKSVQIPAVQPGEKTLVLSGRPNGDQIDLTLTLGNNTASVTTSVPASDLLGNVALVSQYKGKTKKARGENFGYRFTDWELEGEAFNVSPKQAFGPLLWSMYTLNNSRSENGFIMKMSALTGPLGKKDNQTVELQIQQNGRWKSLGDAKLDNDAWVATFQIPNWNEKLESNYRLVYLEKHKDGSTSQNEWSGIIKANPSGRPLRLGALTCQNDYAFPYEPVLENLIKLDPDMLYFSGDQLYENHGGFGIIRDPADLAILNYLRKFYQFGLSFRHAMKNCPTVCLPDDHDVFQGNIWGEGGAAMKNISKGASSKGGYREPARMVNAVHRTNTAHHPDPYDANPSLQDISVYYTDLVYGSVSFAIIADRQWKSGPERVETGSGRADHVLDPKFDTSVLDKDGLVLLGERQEKFLEQWGEDWRGHGMKVLLSQTVFAGVATHHGLNKQYLKADLDSGAWPQTQRNKAIDIIRKSMALHINGDQHLTTLSQYGVDKQRDSNWSFCTPAIAAGYPRSWLPDEVGIPHQNRPTHNHDNTGEYLDGCGNKVYVYSVGNPVKGVDKNRYKKAHQKASGFGLVTIDTEAKTYHLDCYKFAIDATDGNPENQFPGWPVVIHQSENRGENRIS
ncbi:alkaline phosphatase D family protein [bacterium]|nr:alkaline phosphatase D family protein [bacterium]